MRAKRRSLAAAVVKLREALGQDVGGSQRDWADRVDRALGVLIHALRLHDANLESADGNLVDIDTARSPSGTLQRQVGRLHQGLEGCLREARALRATVEAAEAGTQAGGIFPGFRAFRDRAGELLTALDRYEEAEARVILETTTTDIGAGD